MQAPMPDLLRHVSRSFFLSLRVLPAPVRPQIGLAYLLARITDTIADTQLVSVGSRRAALHQMRSAIRALANGLPEEIPDLGELKHTRQPSGGEVKAERTLLEHAETILQALADLKPGDRRLVRDLLDTIIEGQDSDLSRFGLAGMGRIIALETDEDLEEYTYRVAGCVGEFWTKMCRAHLFAGADLDDTALLASGIRFGKGLQMVNILRDLPEDLHEGRCYIPRARLAEHGLEPAALLHAAEMGRFRPLYAIYLEQARELLATGWSYTNSLPRGQVRIRLACAWPILIGMHTLAQLRAANVLDRRHRIKVSRGEVRRLMARSIMCYPSTRAWDRLYRRAGADSHHWPL
jgi:farnesyl-diphosphate farnesyltransferase